MRISLPSPNEAKNIKLIAEECIACEFEHDDNVYTFVFRYFGYKRACRIGQTVKTPLEIQNFDKGINLSAHMISFEVNDKPCHIYYEKYSGIDNLQEWFDYIHLKCFGLFGHPLQKNSIYKIQTNHVF